ncbi:hypothetical protein [Rhodopirellula sp. P2]|nr:hypothetical protein [Rhodopirellula sp. P2]WDQ19575.1 hypothetical protein PSR62_19305 [Rhodopirellula sp. P2]
MATGQMLLFLHADNRLPEDWWIQRVFSSGVSPDALRRVDTG